MYYQFGLMATLLMGLMSLNVQLVNDFSGRQTTWNHISPLFFYDSTYRYTKAHIKWLKKCKIDTLFHISNQFFLNWLFSWEFGKVSQNWKEEWNKEIHHSKKISLFKTQVITFLNLKRIVKSGGVSIMLNLFFYVFKKESKFSC